jgi:phage I-like protein
LRCDIALAPCAFEIAPPAADAGNLVEIQVTPAGAFTPRDGRANMPKSGSWKIDAAIAAKVIAAFNALKTPLVLDYEHQTLQAEENGRPAPAAGFFKSLEWRDGQGLFATVDLTANAKRFIADGEYKYFSPVFAYDPNTGAVQQLLMGALTNNPALDGMAPIAMRAAARFAFHDTNEDSTVNKLHAAVCSMLGLNPDNTSEDDAVNALAAHNKKAKDGADASAKARAELGVPADAGDDAVTTAIATLKTRADAAKPDPAKFVGIEVVEELRREVATLSAKRNQDDVDQLVANGLKDGRLLKSMEPWARELGKKDVAQLKAYIDAATPIAALTGSQTGGNPPPVEGNEHQLNADEVAICKATGIGEKEFAAAKKTA